MTPVSKYLDTQDQILQYETTRGYFCLATNNTSTDPTELCTVNPTKLSIVTDVTYNGLSKY